MSSQKLVALFSWYGSRTAKILWRLLRLSSHPPTWGLQKPLLFSLVSPFTMVSNERLNNVYKLAVFCETHQVKGAFVECGVWRGGMIAGMARLLEKVDLDPAGKLCRSRAVLEQSSARTLRSGVRFVAHRRTGVRGNWLFRFAARRSQGRESGGALTSTR